MVDMDKCDIKGCENRWAYRYGMFDMCEFHYKTQKQMLSQSNNECKKVRKYWKCMICNKEYVEYKDAYECCRHSYKSKSKREE